ncbi:MAG: hypothetical protein NTW93_00660 [Phycisphaerae bacterium]|nr:hypothetical protein [Phycisphaerae bacterium]
MGKKDEIRKSETFVNYDAEGKKIIRIYSFARKVKKNEPNVEDNVFKKLRENSKNLKEYFPAYPFRSGLQKADGFLHYSPMCEKSLIKSIGGFQLHLTQAELTIIDKTVGSRKLSDIKCFLIQKCNNQNTESLSWNDILDNLKFWLKQTNSQRKTTSGGKAGETKNKPDTENIAVDDKELTILIELNAGDNKTFSQVEITASTSIKRGTLKDKLLRLEKIGLVHRPLGKRKGYQITDKGREIAKRHQ